MKKKRLFLTLAICLLAVIPAFAVFNEKDFSKTLSVLRFELKEKNDKMERSRSRIRFSNDMQHRAMVDMLKKCNELSLILYSQNQDYTFDVTYSLKEVTEKYDKFNKKKMPYDDIIATMDIEIERYERLAEALRRIPPILDEIDIIPDSISVSKDSLEMDLGGPIRDYTSHRRIPDSLRIQRRPGQNGMFGGMGGRDSVDRRPFVLDSLGQIDRDSCIAYAINLLQMYKESREKIAEDNEHYQDMSERLTDTYEYAQARYQDLQKRIFVDGQDNYFKVLASLPRYTRQAFQDAASKYGRVRFSDSGITERSEWRGPAVSGFIVLVLFYLLLSTVLSSAAIVLMSKLKKKNFENFKKRRLCITLLIGVAIFALSIMIAKLFWDNNFFKMASTLLLVFAWLVAAILISLLIRLKPKQMNSGIRIYTPLIIMGLLVITFRIIFIPNKLVNLIFPPLLLGFTFWQIVANNKLRKKVNKSDIIYSWITCVVFAATTIMAWSGFVLLSIQIIIWWLFQLAIIATITALYDILDYYFEKHVKVRKEEYRKDHHIMEDKEHNAYIEVTWIYDMFKTAVMPVIAILSVPISLWLASGVFDLTELTKQFFFKPFFNLSDSAGNEVLHLSLYKLVLITSLFFIFRYISYLIKGFYKVFKIDQAMERSGKSFVHANEINFTLANNVIAIVTWGIYIIVAIVLLKIPMGAISIVAAGLATGIGLALKDVLNNFIYGIQLMSGRLRVGDYIECDGVRGRVDNISYQCTQIVTLEGAIMAFTNTTLFNKNFKNLTRDNSYEFVKIMVGVKYGSDVEKVRQVLLDAMQQMFDRKDRFGRSILQKKSGINVAFNSFDDSSIELAVKQYVLVEEELAYIAAAKEIIYNALNENGIEIPFPQRDIHIIKGESED
jgi:Small-conductance mechanosensitive channel